MIFCHLPFTGFFKEVIFKIIYFYNYFSFPLHGAGAENDFIYDISGLLDGHTCWHEVCKRLSVCRKAK